MSFDRKVKELCEHLKSEKNVENCRGYTATCIHLFARLEHAEHQVLSKYWNIDSIELHAILDEIYSIESLPSFYGTRAKSILAQATQNAGKFREAELIRKDLCIRYKSSNARDRVCNLDGVVQCLLFQGRVQEALECAASNVRICEEELQLRGGLSWVSRNTLAGLYLDIGKYEDAAVIFEKLRQEIINWPWIDRDSDLFLSIHLNFAFSLMRSNRVERALPLSEEIFERYCHLRGRNNIDTANAEIKLAECLLRSSECHRALVHAKESLSTYVKLDEMDVRRSRAVAIGLQCAEQCEDEFAKYEIFKNVVMPMLSADGFVADELRRFFVECPRLVPWQFRRELQ